MKIIDLLFKINKQNDTIVQCLNNVQLFENLSLYDLENLAEVITVKKFPENAIIFKQNDEADGLWIIEKGILKIYMEIEEGKEIELTQLVDYNYFGEMALIQNAKRSASVKTIIPSTLYFLSKENFEKLIRKNLKTANKILYNISRMLSKRLQESNIKFLSK
ncbi:MAG TPA: cyclic nucleotide-binding domain-containing protein [bacterium]|nr:cyclic nucleotide-binding domain-containing protein [bacterium]HOL47524.1 cyclic nucleotide-binding domain-containing protein [bacterium]HPQ19124.1 cyclic nucleotide-binding domain-containing protein [bacterium]